MRHNAGFDLWLRWRDQLVAGWVRYAEIEEYAAIFASAAEFPRLVVLWWFNGLVVLRGKRKRFSGEPELIDVPIEGRDPEFWQIEAEGLRHLECRTLVYDLELMLDPALVEFLKNPAPVLAGIADGLTVVGAGYSAKQLAETERSVKERLTALASELEPLAAPEGLPAVQPAPPVAKPLTREQAILRIIATGKVPALNDYPVDKFIGDVIDLVKPPKNARGYKRDALMRLYKRLSRSG